MEQTAGITEAVLTDKGIEKADNTVEQTYDNRVLWALRSMNNRGTANEIVHSPICKDMTHPQIIMILSRLLENGDIVKR